MAGNVEKSERDTRVYEYFTLRNSIKCIVISDATCEISAAAMNVHVGSIHEDVPGLAHYLEHMLFMGTSKYPVENEYSNFLSDNAGSSNAFTDNEDTNFFFKVSSGQLFPALEMFSHFFIAPLFNEGSLERELKAVDSEFHKNLLDDNWRMQQIVASNASAPINHFGLGNKATLDLPDIRDRIIAFYQKFYSANLMSLVIYGKEDTQQLKNWAVELFSGIENKEVVLPEYPLPSFTNTKTLTRVVSVKDTKSLRILWGVPNITKMFEYKPEGYIAHLLGHEGQNSLLSCLKHENLAEELVCYHEDPFTFVSYLSLEIKLTDKGYAQYTHVAEIAFAFIKMLRNHTPQEYIFEEVKEIAAAEFLFKSKKDPYWFCQKLSSRLVRYPPAKVMTGPELYYTFNSELITQFIQYLDLANSQLFLISKLHNTEGMCEEKWFGTLHSTEAFTEELNQKLENPNVNLGKIVLGLPKPNPYIPEHYNLLPASEGKLPVNLVQNERYTVWHKQDSKYKTDKVYGQLMIFCNSYGFDTSPYFFMLAKMWEKILCEKIREEGYIADIAGLKHEVDVDCHGVRVTLNGFSQKYSTFFEFLVETIGSFCPGTEDEHIFHDQKNEFLTSMSNCFFSKPTTQIQRIIYELSLVGGYFSQLEKLKALVHISLSDVIWFSKKWLKNVHFEWFVIGNISSESALLLAETCMNKFISLKSPTFLTPDQYLQLKITKLPRGKPQIFQSVLTDTSNTNSAVITQFQIGPETLRLECLMGIIENYLEEPCFDSLRTKEQLGYIVSSYAHKMRGINNFMILVQSSTHCPGQIIERITAFLDSMKTEIAEISDKHFKKLLKATMESTLKKDLSLAEEYQRQRFEIDSAAYIFDRRKLMKDTLNHVTKEEFQQAFANVFSNTGRRLDIALVSHNMLEQENAIQKDRVVISSLSQFKREHSVWPQVHIRNKLK